MNVTIPEKQKIKKRIIILYIILAVICIFAITVIIQTNVLGKDVVDEIFGVSKITKKSEKEEENYIIEFEKLFDNTIEGENDKKIVRTGYTKEKKGENIDINVNIPYINIINETTARFNNTIRKGFEAKAEELVSQDIKNVIYTVKYKAYFENNILSVIVYSDLKQENYQQRKLIQTFNYDVEKKKELSFKEIIEQNGLKEENVQNKINKGIKKEQTQTDSLKNLGYEVFSRDLKSDIYKVDNISEFFIYQNNIYVIFAYGNDKLTSVLDVIII